MGNHRLSVGYIWNLIQETTVNLNFLHLSGMRKFAPLFNFQIFLPFLSMRAGMGQKQILGRFSLS